MPTAASIDPGVVLEALAQRADGAAVLAARARGAAVVGGFVRDTLIGIPPREVDVVVEGDAEGFARELGGVVTIHAAFGTARAERDGWSIDVAAARSERYPQPGALPVVAPASLEQDLGRRDFAVNALAVTIDDGELLAVAGALEDLSEQRLRVLHDRSFLDDPTRVMRLARYAHRLGFSVEPHTAALARAARLDTVSGARIGAELRLALAERDPLAPLSDLSGKLPIVIDRRLVESALALAPPDASRELVILAAITREIAPPDWIAELELTAHERDVVLAAANAAQIADAIEQAVSASSLHDALKDVPPEVVAIAGGLGPTAAARRWLEELRHVRLEIGGDDLIAAGIPSGPELGARLERTLRRKLDGQLAGGRRAELVSALGDAS
jgi:tRNA nucleotidyltransferase (CCA-adding enzyme)